MTLRSRNCYRMRSLVSEALLIYKELKQSRGPNGRVGIHDGRSSMASGQVGYTGIST